MKRQKPLPRVTSRRTTRTSLSKGHAQRVTHMSRSNRDMPLWQVILVIILCLCYLRNTRNMPTRDDRVMRTLIIIVGMMLIVVALTAAGAPDVVSTILQHWPILP